MYRVSQTGEKHFEEGDVVSVGKGKVLYNVIASFHGYEKVTVQSQNTGRHSIVERDRLVLVLNVRDNSSEILNKETEQAEVPAPEPKHDEHIPGESPAEYKARTGKKLDGRTTSYGRAILAALQWKPMFLGRAKSFNTKAKRVNRWTTAK